MTTRIYILIGELLIWNNNADLDPTLFMFIYVCSNSGVYILQNAMVLGGGGGGKGK